LLHGAFANRRRGKCVTMVIDTAKKAQPNRPASAHGYSPGSFNHTKDKASFHMHCTASMYVGGFTSDRRRFPRHGIRSRGLRWQRLAAGGRLSFPVLFGPRRAAQLFERRRRNGMPRRTVVRIHRAAAVQPQLTSASLAERLDHATMSGGFVEHARALQWFIDHAPLRVLNSPTAQASRPRHAPPHGEAARDGS